MIIILFIIMILLVMALVTGCIVYDFRQFRQSGLIRKISEKNKCLSCALSSVPFVLITICAFFFGIISAIIILLHLTVFLMMCNLILYGTKKLVKKSFTKTASVVSAIILTTVYMSIGWYNAHNVIETAYTFETEKQLSENSLRIVQIADSHLGVTLDGKSFSHHLQNIHKKSPDIIVITGDFVDDNSNKADMIKACQALGNLQTRYGVYFTFGNHDKGYFENSHNFTEDELRQELLKNNVKILEDEAALIDDSFYLVGRQDKSEKKRKSIDELISGLDKSKYIVVLDHQPNDYDNEAKTEVDLVLSGHTHGGHIFPAGVIGLITGANDKVYGTEKINKTDFVVTSGISGWEIPFKTGAISEYVVIDVKCN
ncbi:MAG: metallophosphoesterase [Oscillospiraceae bacterium]|nr:metallophosphoesterase [Oscillospiraceae bacterium]